MRFNQMAVDQDYFVPVRDPAQTMPIDTLPGATNLSEIADIEYIQKKLVTALRVPKTFLGFEEAIAEGKGLALQDIRFARTINRIQKSMLQELNKIAIVHLFLLGFEDELTNFKLSLTNPSTQADLLKIDVWKEKVLLYKDLTADPGSGIAPVSVSWAKKHILGFSDDEIKLDLQQQRIERAVGEELKKTQDVIKSTGLFDNIDKLYSDKKEKGEEGSESSETSEPPMGGEESSPPPMGGEEEPEGTPPPITSSIDDRKSKLVIENHINREDEIYLSEEANNLFAQMDEKIENLLKL